MNKSIKYLIYILLALIGIAILPNIALRGVFNHGGGVWTILLNAFLIPISLLLTIKWINTTFDKDWWALNFLLIIGAVCASVYLGFLNWAYWADKTPGGWGSTNVDKGTYMVLNLELTIGLGIIGVALAIKIFRKIKSLLTTKTATK